jgi:hypothetical protein
MDGDREANLRCRLEAVAGVADSVGSQNHIRLTRATVLLIAFLPSPQPTRRLRAAPSPPMKKQRSPRTSTISKLISTCGGCTSSLLKRDGAEKLLPISGSKLWSSMVTNNTTTGRLTQLGCIGHLDPFDITTLS